MAGVEEHLKLNEESIVLLNDSAIINKIIDKSDFWKENKNFKHKSNKSCGEGPFKQIKGIYDDGKIHYVTSPISHDDQNVPKLIISGATYPRIYYDKKGEYGLFGTGVNYWIGTKKELDKLEDFLKTKLAAFLTKELRFRYGFVEFKYFPDVTKLDLSEINDETLIAYFDLTEFRSKILETEFPKREYTFKEITCAEEEKKAGGARTFFDKTRKRRRI